MKPDFSIVTGGPLFRLWRRANLADEGMKLQKERLLFAVLIAWLPLLLLLMIDGRAWTETITHSFFEDVDIQVKLLVALPLLILAESKVHHRLPKTVETFLTNGLLTDASRPRFAAALSSVKRLRDSIAAEVMLLVFVYAVGIGIIWFHRVTPDATSWYVVLGSSGPSLSLAGWWALGVSLPLFQFVLMRWYYRLFIWGRFLWQVSRMDLHLQPVHPDGTAGLQFLSLTTRAFAGVMLAQGVTLSAMMANRIFHEGAQLMDFKVELIGTVCLMILVIIGPLLSFYPKLRAAKEAGLYDLELLGQRYACEFGSKWGQSDTASKNTLIGSADIQSLADLRNSYLIVAGMNVIPLGLPNIIYLAAMTLLPITPLLLTIFSVEQLLDRMLKVIF
jgi:hypothetical protein